MSDQSSSMDAQADLVLPFEQLKARHAKSWSAISAARDEAKAHTSELRKLLDSIGVPENTTVVAFGSLARLECTSGSDLDWTLLLDGPASPDHYPLIREIGQKVKDAGFPGPGRTATFGQLTSSHELIHHIGGIEDTNQNLTRRVLMILESCALTDPIAHDRVMRSVLKRYIANDLRASGSKIKVPRFLLNDIARLWRTFAVDYASKKWERADEGWALRNAKLRISRKLTFVKGLLLAYDCDLNPDFPEVAEPTPEILGNLLTARCIEIAGRSPIDVLSAVLLTRGKSETAIAIIDAYDRFLAILNDENKRKHLEDEVAFSTALADDVFKEVRDLSHEFRDAIERLFFDDDAEIARLTRRYGVF